LHELTEAEHPAAEDVESAVYVAQLSRALSESLDELPLACQQVFAWHRIEHWTVPEIAQHMGLSVSTVEKHLTKTMRHLQQKLQKFAS
jgi:RNA polymerase sigma-70 factor (ECF subfamily)